MADSVKQMPYEHPKTEELDLCQESGVLSGQSIQSYKYDNDSLTEQ